MYCHKFGRAASSLTLELRPQRWEHHGDHAPQQRLYEEVVEVEVVAPQRDAARMHLEHAAHPGLQAQRPDNHRVGPLGQHRIALGGDSVNLHLEAESALPAPKQLHDALTTTHGREAHVLPLDVVGHQPVGGVEVLVLQRVEKGLHSADVIDIGFQPGSLVGHGCQRNSRALWQGRPVRIAVVAGPDPGHAFPAIALCRRFLAAGDTPTLLTGTEWLDTARGAGVDAVELDGLDPTEADDDTDAGAKIHRRAARMAVLNVPRLRDLAPDLVVSDVITAGGGMAAELLGLPWVELCPHPLYRPSKGLPPVGSGLAPGVGIRGRLRDVAMRALTARSWRQGLRQRSTVRVEIGLPAADPGPLRRLVATLPALEVPRPDWPCEAVVVGPLHFEPTSSVLPVPDGRGPVVVVAPSTAATGTQRLAELALKTLIPGEAVP